MSYIETYLAEARDILARMDRDVLERMATTIAEVRERGGRMFFVGSGGGAGHASHAVCDFRKIGGIECYTPTDNVSELTARINDDGWDTSYANWLRASRIGRKDAVFVFSVGGGNAAEKISVNLVECVKLAKEVGASVLGVVGRDGGYTAEAGDAVLVVPKPETGDVTTHTEAFQAVVWHMLVAHPAVKTSEMKWESVRGSDPA